MNGSGGRSREAATPRRREWYLLGPDCDPLGSPEEVARLVLELVPGERRLVPAFGWRAHLMPRVETPAERAVAAVLAEEALSRWAPELGITRVDVEAVVGGEVRLRLEARGRERRLAVRLRRDGAAAAGDGDGGRHGP